MDERMRPEYWKPVTRNIMIRVGHQKIPQLWHLLNALWIPWKQWRETGSYTRSWPDALKDVLIFSVRQNSNSNYGESNGRLGQWNVVSDTRNSCWKFIHESELEWIHPLPVLQSCNVQLRKVKVRKKCLTVVNASWTKWNILFDQRESFSTLLKGIFVKSPKT